MSDLQRFFFSTYHPCFGAHHLCIPTALTKYALFFDMIWAGVLDCVTLSVKLHVSCSYNLTSHYTVIICKCFISLVSLWSLPRKSMPHGACLTVTFTKPTFYSADMMINNFMEISMWQLIVSAKKKRNGLLCHWTCVYNGLNNEKL